MSKSNSNVTYFTSESVCEGHPDKIADSISDSILDELLKQDPNSRAGIEAVVGNDRICLFGEIKSTAQIDIEKIVRNRIKTLGYDNPAWDFSYQSPFENYLHQQSSDIAIGVDQGGAGDQGMMFGYAINETESLMPLPISLAHQLVQRIDQTRKTKKLAWLRPDGKAQVTIAYEGNKIIGIAKLVLAVAHSEQIKLEEIKPLLIKEVIEPVLEAFSLQLPDLNNIIINGTGIWNIPGPASDAGLTGRKIVVDTYGGYARVGGGAFSGKDPSKVDRSGAYAARYIAKNIVAKKLALKCEVGLAYVIGQAQPLMQTINTFGTEQVDLDQIESFKNELIDTSVRGIITKLNLLRPIYLQTSTYGHFGKPDLPLEELI